MVRLTGNFTTTAGVAVCGAAAVYFPTSVNATESTAAGCGTADTTNSSGVFQCLSLAANKYDIRVSCGSSFRWSRYADEIQHATYQTGDGCTCGLEGNYTFGIGNDVSMRWSLGDPSNHSFVIGIGDTSQQIHITDLGAIATDWARCAGTHPEVAIHSNTTPATDYLAIGNHDGTTASWDVVGGTTFEMKIAGNVELSVTASGLNVPANSDILFTGTTGTNDINLVDCIADALSIVRGSTDFMVFNTSTPRLTITPVTTITGLITGTGGITFPANADVTFTGTTGTNDITLVDCIADALSIVRGSTDVIVFDTSTPRVTIIPATTITGLITGTGGITFPANADVTFTGTTGTNDIVLVDSIADALSIRRACTDMMVFDSSTPEILVTPSLRLVACLDAEGVMAIGNGSALDGNITAHVDRDFSTSSSGQQLRLSGIMTVTGGTSCLSIMNFSCHGITINSAGTHPIVATVNIDEPNITETCGAVTTAVTLRVAGAATEGCINLAFLVDDGASRFDGDTIHLTGARIGADSAANEIDDASQGCSSTTLYIGNASITVCSDQRLKKCITETAICATKLINDLRVVDYVWCDPTDVAPVNRNSRGVWTGLIAQETVDVAPWVVNAPDRTCPTCKAGKACKKHTGRWHLEYQHLVPALIKAIQELSTRMDLKG